MEGAQQVGAVRRVYRYKGLQRDFCVILGLVFGMAGCGVAVAAFLQPSDLLAPLLIFAAILVGLGVFMFALAFSSSLVIDGTRIEVRAPFSSRATDLGEVEGFRTSGPGSGDSWTLILKSGSGTFPVPSSFETDDAFQSWLQQVPNLDARDQEALITKIEQQQEIGAKLGDWLAKLTVARHRAMGLLAITVASAIGLNIVPMGWRQPFVVILIVAPFAAAYLCLQSPALYALFKKRSDPRAETSYILIAAGFGLLIRLRELHLVSIQPLIAFMLFVVLAIAFTDYHASKDGAKRGAFVGTLVFAILFAYSSVTAIDVFFDSAKANRISADVLGARIAKSRGMTTHYLRVSPWGPIKKESDISVPSAIYLGTHAGDLICFDMHPGRLGGSWYRVVPCLDPEQ
jgi:hypothetical protein